MKFVVIGAGAWGTAFALHLVQPGHTVTLVPRRREQAAALESRRENADYLPGVPLPPQLGIASDLASAAAGADVAFIACPAQALRETAERWRSALPAGAGPSLIVSLAKGLELGTHLRPSQVLAAVLPAAAIGALPGPTTAGEIARGLPAAMVLATTGAAKSKGFASEYVVPLIVTGLAVLTEVKPGFGRASKF